MCSDLAARGGKASIVPHLLLMVPPSFVGNLVPHFHFDFALNFLTCKICVCHFHVFQFLSFFTINFSHSL